MSRNAYLAIARLSSHPMFSGERVQLVCPLCREGFGQVSVAERHFLAHDPTAEQGWRYLSGRTWDRVRAARGWPTTEEALARWPG